ncbi:MAG: type II secretion system F family protein [Labilithrix sp.]|nr:type II secretion system F family protein [Labilithrix sp.]MCW5815472.1 type II secretion system F family protein [Labilithrix sp.]
MSADQLSAQTIQLKWASLGVTSFALFVGTWLAAADQSGPVYRYSARYTASLEQKLRPMFIFTPGRLIAYGQCLAAFLLVTGHVLFTIEFWWVGLFFIAIGPTAYIEYMRRERVLKLEEQLDNFILALANALKTTPSIGAAFNSVAAVISNPMQQEVDLAIKEMKVGSTLDQALLHMAARVGSRQLDSALSAILIGRQVGGNLPKVLETTAGTLREMRRLEGVVRTKTAEGKMQLWVIAMMPFALLLGLNYLWPGYFAPLTAGFIGYLICIICTAFWVASIVLARKVLNVDI